MILDLAARWRLVQDDDPAFVTLDGAERRSSIQGQRVMAGWILDLAARRRLVQDDNPNIG